MTCLPGAAALYVILSNPMFVTCDSKLDNLPESARTTSLIIIAQPATRLLKNFRISGFDLNLHLDLGPTAPFAPFHNCHRRTSRELKTTEYKTSSIMALEVGKLSAPNALRMYSIRPTLDLSINDEISHSLQFRMETITKESVQFGVALAASIRIYGKKSRRR